MMKAIYFRAYLSGHSGRLLPRQVRRLIAGTELHRAWLLGYLVFFEQDGIKFGPANPYGITGPERA